MKIEQEAFNLGEINSKDGWIHHVHTKSYHARFTYVYKHNNTIKGFICIRPFVNNDEVETFATIYNHPINNMGNLISEVYVLPKFRDQGIGKALFKYAIGNMYTLSALYSEVDTRIQGTQDFQKDMGLKQVGEMSLLNIDNTPAYWQLFEIQNNTNEFAFE